MLVQMDIGGVWVTFGEPLSPNKPEPFYPYLLDIDPIQDTTGDETGAVAFVLHIKAKDLVYLNVRRDAKVLQDDLSLKFEGVVRTIAYTEHIRIGIEA